MQPRRCRAHPCDSINWPASGNLSTGGIPAGKQLRRGQKSSHACSSGYLYRRGCQPTSGSGPHCADIRVAADLHCTASDGAAGRVATTQRLGGPRCWEAGSMRAHFLLLVACGLLGAALGET